VLDPEDEPELTEREAPAEVPGRGADGAETGSAGISMSPSTNESHCAGLGAGGVVSSGAVLSAGFEEP
jgi:hypothetical protein